MPKKETFESYYKTMPERVVIAPKKDFIKRIATITGKSERQVIRWIKRECQPDENIKDIIAKELGIKKMYLFPVK